MTVPTPSADDRPKLDVRELVRDVLTIGGFTAFTGGVAMLSRPWAFIVSGALLCVIGLVATFRGGPRGPR